MAVKKLLFNKSLIWNKGLGGGSGLPSPAYKSDFVNGIYKTGMTSQSFSEQYTYTRSGVAWDVDNGELIEFAANIPMVVDRGLAAFDSSTNVITHNDGNKSTYGSTTGLVSDGTPFITGFSNALSFAGTPAGTKSAYKIISYSASTVYTFSFYIKMDDSSLPVFGTASGDSSIDAVVIMYGAAYDPSNIVDLGGGIYRVCCSQDSAALTSTAFGVLKYGGNSSKGFTVLGYQLEDKDYASPIIITEGGSVTRNAGSMLNNAAISGWYNQSEGTFVAQVGRPKDGQESGTGMVVQVDNGTGNERHSIFYAYSAAPTLGAVAYDGGVAQASFSSSTPASNDSTKIAYAYKLNDAQAVKDGANIGTDALITMPTVTTLRVGNYLGSLFIVNNYIQAFEYYPTREDQATLEARTSA